LYAGYQPFFLFFTTLPRWQPLSLLTNPQQAKQQNPAPAAAMMLT
jgi:hypothetical protein